MNAARTPATVSAVAHCFVPALLDDLSIEGADGRHLASVPGVVPGEVITAADDSGGWRSYGIVAVEREREHVQMRATEPEHRTDAANPALAVAFGLTPARSPETLIAQLTELGVDRVVPVRMAKSGVPWSAAERAARHDDFQTTARAAAMQSRRTRIPVIEPVHAFREVLAHPALVIGHPDGDPIAALAEQLVEPPGGEWCAVVGPGGGFSADEHLALGAAPPYPPLAVGRNVLRAETAAVAVAAVLTAIR